MTDDERTDESAPLEHPPVPADRPRPELHGPRDPGDAWAYGPDGRKAWGRFGAAGLLVDDGNGRVLLQHRVEWSHFGGTWGIPGGARHEHEDAVTGALRESAEEAGVPSDSLRLRTTSVLDLGFWTYTTVVATAVVPFEPVVADRESLALEWVPLERVEELQLHPGFGASWPSLRDAMRIRPVVIVDAANVVGSRPDGWWRDRAGAARRLVEDIHRVARAGVDAPSLGLQLDAWWPSWTVVLEGDAKSAETPAADDPRVAVEVVRADGNGDDAIVLAAEQATAARSVGGVDAPVVVVTADRELRERVEALGASTVGPGWLRDRF